MNKLENEIHTKIIDTLRIKLRVEMSDFDKYKLLKNLLYEIDNMIFESEE